MTVVDEFQIPPSTGSRTGLVLYGGGSRGAYEVGGLQYLRNDFPKVFGKHAPIDVMTGTSVGAINCAFLAACAEDLDTQADRLAMLWRSLRIEELLAPRELEFGSLARMLLGRPPKPPPPGAYRYGGLVDTTGLERVVVKHIPWRNIDRNLRRGHLGAMTVSATQVATGHTIVFVAARDGVPKTWSRDPFVRHKAARIGPRHVLASAALPLLFPSVKIGDDFYTDGGLRQNTPMSPAIRLGATRLLLVSLRHVNPIEQPVIKANFPSPLFLLGKTLNALMLDHTEYDVDRLQRINAIIDAGERAFGPSFSSMMNDEMQKQRGARFKKIEIVHIRPSFDIGQLASDFVASGKVRLQSRLARKLLSRLAESESPRENDLLSYLMFDGDYAAELIALGRRDAAKHEEALLRLFSRIDEPEGAPAGITG